MLVVVDGASADYCYPHDLNEWSRALLRRNCEKMSDAKSDQNGVNPDDHALMERVASGERDALAMLVRRHQERVIALAFRFLGRWDAAEDVCQDTFIRVFRSAGAYRPDAQFTTWLYRIVANQCWDRRRKAAREPVVDVPEHVVTDHADGAAVIEQQERQLAVRRAVAALPDRQRLALVLHRYEGFSHADIAKATGWSVGAVESCIVRAYARLRETLSELQDEDR